MKLFPVPLAVGCCLLLASAFQEAAVAQTAPTEYSWYSWPPSLPSASLPDQTLYTNVRFDKLEWNRLGGHDSARWDMEASIGGDYEKLFLKSEGFYDGRIGRFDEAQIQLLYSHLISYYFNFQAGLRQDMSSKSSRTYAVIGFEGLAPGFIETDTDLYVSQKGEVSASFTAFYDLLITNRLILQPRVDVKLQMQRIPELELGSGVTDFELGARLRYEFTRNIAPYVGVVWDRKAGETASIARRNGEPISSVYAAGGVRLAW
jgi:copper resistance protein B